MINIMDISKFVLTLRWEIPNLCICIDFVTDAVSSLKISYGGSVFFLSENHSSNYNLKTKIKNSLIISFIDRHQYILHC